MVLYADQTENQEYSLSLETETQLSNLLFFDFICNLL